MEGLDKIAVQVVESAVLFILIWCILKRVLFKPFLSLLDERDARTVGDERAAREKKVDSKELSKEIEIELQKARLEGIKDRDEAVRLAKDKAQEVIQAASVRAQEKREKAREEIERLKAAAEQELLKESTMLSDVVVRQLVSHKLH